MIFQRQECVNTALLHVTIDSLIVIICISPKAKDVWFDTVQCTNILFMPAVYLQDVIYEALDDISPPQLDSELPAHEFVKYDAVYNKFVDSVMSQRESSRRRRQSKS